MSLEALVSLRFQGETETKKRGDILVVKLAGSPWGSEERRVHQVVEWDDPELEAQLLQQRAAGEPHPVIAYPYAEYEKRPLQDEKGQPLKGADGKELPEHLHMARRSTQGVNLDGLSEELRMPVMNPDRAHRKLRAQEYSRRA